MAKLIARELRAKHPTFMSDAMTKMSELEWTRTDPEKRRELLKKQKKGI